MKYISKIALAIILSITVNSCSESNVDKINSNNEILNFEFTKTNKSDVTRISNWIDKNDRQNILTRLISLENKSEIQITLDYENSISLDYNGKELIIINQKELDVTKNENYAITFIKDNDIYIKSNFLIKTTNVSENIKKVEHYDFNNNHLFTTIYNNINQTITNTRNIVVNGRETTNLLSKTNRTECGESYGGAVVECMQDVYSNHGWLSVWASVQTAFIPQTAAAFAIACAIEEYPEDGECFDSF